MFFNLLFSKFYIKDKKENKNRKQQFFLIFLIQTIEYKKYFYNKSINKIFSQIKHSLMLRGNLVQLVSLLFADNFTILRSKSPLRPFSFIICSMSPQLCNNRCLFLTFIEMRCKLSQKWMMYTV